jgi:hypothetical protein
MAAARGNGNGSIATVHAKCEHLAEVDARHTPLSTSPLMTLAGLVNHLRWVEYY